MAQYDYEKTLFSYLENLKQQLNNRPLNLGGIFGAGGGVGGPPGNFVGVLPQTRVAFDTTEAETWTYVTVSGVPSGVSLVTNLNRIRYRLARAAKKQALFIFSGTASVGANPTRIYNFLDDMNIVGVYVSVSTPPTGANLIADVHMDGTTIFTNQSNRPVVVTGEYYGSSTIIAISGWTTNSYLTAEIDQVGSIVAGEYPVIYVVYD